MENITKRAAWIVSNKEISMVVVVVVVMDLVVAVDVAMFMKEIYFPPEMIILNKSRNTKAHVIDVAWLGIEGELVVPPNI